MVNESPDTATERLAKRSIFLRRKQQHLMPRLVDVLRRCKHARIPIRERCLEAHEHLPTPEGANHYVCRPLYLQPESGVHQKHRNIELLLDTVNHDEVGPEEADRHVGYVGSFLAKEA